MTVLLTHPVKNLRSNYSETAKCKSNKNFEIECKEYFFINRTYTTLRSKSQVDEYT